MLPRATIAALALLALLPPAAGAAPRPKAAPPGQIRPRVEHPSKHTDRWTTVCPGIRHLHRKTAEPLSVHVVVVDLRAPGVVVEVTPYEQRWLKPSQYGRVSGAVAAVNGGFWSVFDQKAEGLVMHGGRRWKGARDDEFYGFFAIRKDGRAEISEPELVVRKVGALREAISGRQLILKDGRVTRKARCADGCRYRQPRTAVGTSADGHRVFLAVVDGRQKHSRGINLVNLARLLKKLGADRVINLDGGGSAAMYLTTSKGLVNRPADRRERDVLNHIGVFWRPTKAQLAALAARREAARRLRAGAGPMHTLPRTGDPELKVPPKPTTAGVPTGFRRWVQLHWRELFSPRNLLIATPALLGLFVLGVWAIRRRRRRIS